MQAAPPNAQCVQAQCRKARCLTLQSRGLAPASRVKPLISNVRFRMPMHSVRRVLGSSARFRRGRWPSSTPGPVLAVGSLCARHIASEASSFFNRRRSFGAQQLRCEPAHNVCRSAQRVRRSLAPGCSGLPVLRRSAHRSLPVAAAQMQTRGCASSCSSRTLVVVQFVSSSIVGSASHQATQRTQAHLCRQREPNPSVKRTA